MFKTFIQHLFIGSLLVVVVNAAGSSLANLPADQKTSICAKSVAFCLNTCLQKVAVNTCDPISMSWDCQCADLPLPVSVHYFPIQAQQCVMETQDCRNECAVTGKTGQEIDTCSNLCDQKFVCGTPDAKETVNFNKAPLTVPSNAPTSSMSTGVSTQTVEPIIPTSGTTTNSNSASTFPKSSPTSSPVSGGSSSNVSRNVVVISVFILGSVIFCCT